MVVIRLETPWMPSKEIEHSGKAKRMSYSMLIPHGELEKLKDLLYSTERDVNASNKRPKANVRTWSQS